MNHMKKILAAGCSLALLLTPVPAFADTAANPSANTIQASPRLGIPLVGANESAYANVAISRVSNYVNVRTEPNTTSAIVGKIYNNCAATILATVNGEGGKWYQIQSGTVKGYIKAEYFITGAEAEKIAKQVGTVYVTINTATLRLREEPNTTSRILTLLSQDAEYIALKEEGDFVEIQVDATMSGYVHKDYLKQRVEFEQAVSLEEEQKKQVETEKLKKEADEAIAVMEKLIQEENTGSGTPMEEVGLIAANPNGEEPVNSEPAPSETPAPPISAAEETAKAQETETSASNEQKEYGPGQNTVIYGQNGPGSTLSGGSQNGPGSAAAGNDQSGPGSVTLTSATRTAIVAYAKQFLGNPYVYGGTSLTSGTDCSGFTMRIYEHFGISTGRSSRDQAAKGKEISLDAIEPGDLVFYASGDYINHVALYIGGGQIIHASTPKNGIMITTMNYRTPYKAVTFLN